MSGSESVSSTAPESTLLRDSDAKRLLALPRARLRLEFQFALLSAAGGLVLASGQETQAIALLAVFMALFGFVFVDWLRVFELPATIAYLSMGGAAAYCVHDFWGLQQRGQSQMVSVAFLLVLVQGVLMMQRKSRRILEQLAVFCLLELVVAAIFNDVITFGLLMIPIAIIGASALSSLGLVSTMEQIDVVVERAEPTEPPTRLQRFSRWLSGASEPTETKDTFLKTSSPESATSMYLSARSWSRFAVITLAPAVFLVAAAFFYALPRKVEAERTAGGGKALVGFADEVHLEQLGEVMNNPKTALKIGLTDLKSDRPYFVSGSLYLRGRVLENYESDLAGSRPTSKWTTDPSVATGRRNGLPSQFVPPQRYASDRSLYDDVGVSIDCGSMSRPALFSIAPYHAGGTARGVVHAADRWTLARESDYPPYPRISYKFGTHAFYKGRQTRWIAHVADTQRVSRDSDFGLSQLFGRGRFQRYFRYRLLLLRYDRQLIPTASVLAEKILEGIPTEERTAFRIASEMESFLANSPEFSYTLKLDATPEPGMDPIEQFLSRDRRGHCQYFASALAMMLRSVGIPCRLVVGYRTEEYNGLSNYYIARQQHAHAWVEALVDAFDLPEEIVVAGQPRSNRYWLRLDATPGASLDEDRDPGGVDSILDMASNLWEDYVVDMDGERQPEQLSEGSGWSGSASSYRTFMNRAAAVIENIREGRLGGGELSLREKPPLAVVFGLIVLVILAVLASRLKIPTWKRRSRSSSGRAVSDHPSIEFYAQALHQLSRAGIQRESHETPQELSRRVGGSFPMLAELTNSFQQQRYGHDELIDSNRLRRALSDLQATVDAMLNAKG